MTIDERTALLRLIADAIYRHDVGAGRVLLQPRHMAPITELLTAAMLTMAGVGPERKVPDLGARGCGAGRAASAGGG
jgi:hypothetical protein